MFTVVMVPHKRALSAHHTGPRRGRGLLAFYHLPASRPFSRKARCA